MRALLIAAAVGLLAPAAAGATEPVRLKAAGSLRAAMTELTRSWTERTGTPVALEFGASGLLREKIAGGAETDVFASANMEHPQAIAELRGGLARPFARNTLCALSQPGLGVSTETLLERMLDPAVRLATSTPKNDPAGDYAFALFDRAEALRSGATAALKGKALLLTGGAGAPPPPADRSVYGVLMADKAADLFLTYCTNAVVAAREVPGLEVVQVPSELTVGALYGLVVLGGRPEAEQLAGFILSADGRSILARHGFGAP